MRLDSPTPKRVLQQLKIHLLDLVGVVAVNSTAVEIVTNEKIYRITPTAHVGNPMPVSICCKGEQCTELTFTVLNGYSDLTAVYEEVKSDIECLELILKDIPEE